MYNVMMVPLPQGYIRTFRAAMLEPLTSDESAAASEACRLHGDNKYRAIGEMVHNGFSLPRACAAVESVLTTK